MPLAWIKGFNFKCHNIGENSYIISKFNIALREICLDLCTIKNSYKTNNHFQTNMGQPSHQYWSKISITSVAWHFQSSVKL